MKLRQNIVNMVAITPMILGKMGNILALVEA